MNRNSIYLRLSGFVILTAITACALPGQKIQTVPTINPSILATHAARTAEASVQQTQQASIPTAIPPSSTPKVSPITGTSLVILADQGTLFIDPKAGVQITIPPGWLVVRPNEDEYYKAYTLDVVLADPALSDRLTQLQSSNTDFFRMDAIDIRPDHVVAGLPTVMSVAFQPDDFRTLEKWAQAERNKKSPYKEFRFLSSKYQQTADGTRVLVIEERWKGATNATIYHRAIFFTLASGAVIIDLQANIEFKDTVLPEYEQVVNSLTLLNP